MYETIRRRDAARDDVAARAAALRSELEREQTRVSPGKARERRYERLEEIGRRFGLSSLATVHKHLTNLQEKGFIKRAWNRSRSVELVARHVGMRAVELPLLGFVAAGSPIEAIPGTETIGVPEGLVGKRDSYVLRVKGDSMIDEQIRDGDFVIVEDRKDAGDGEMVIALLGGHDVTLKKFYRENGKVRLQPANPAMRPIVVDPDHVQVQVEHGLPGVGIAVEDRAVAAGGEAALGGDRRAAPHHLADELIVVGLEIVQGRHVRARHHQHMHRRLRTDVVERDETLVLVHLRRGNLAGDDAAEETVGHERLWVKSQTDPRGRFVTPSGR